MTHAFAVTTVLRDGKTLYQPVRLVLNDDGFIASAHAIHDPLPYEALAYEYLQGDLARHYMNLQVERAQPQASTKRPPGRPKKDAKP